MAKKEIKDWTLDDFLNELNENLTIEKGKVFSSQEYIDATEDWKRSNLIWTNAEKVVYDKFDKILIDNTVIVDGKFTFGQCWIETNTHEMKNPRLHCERHYFILTKFYGYNEWLHTAVKNLEDQKVQDFMDSVQVGDIIHEPMGRDYGSIPFFKPCYEVVKKNSKSLVVKQLRINKLEDIEEVEEKCSRYDGSEYTRTRYFTHATVTKGDYHEGYNGRWSYGWKDYNENLFKINVKYTDNFEIERTETATLRLETDSCYADKVRTA